jgi:Tol biopolymer transport system component/tRNA A-37 threonylcarbamoyl transferase component Bud32
VDRVADVLQRLSSALADRYRLEHELGQGGMATVYLAEDLKHDRRVAVKVLRPELAAVIGAERFLAEIKLTANLQHPHILPLFDSGEADGFLFYVMPFIQGESLRDRVSREKQLPIEDAVRITREVASALDYAHRHGVIHRDIKPENILLHDGQALVADFGIALAASKAGGTRMTETGMSLGTPHYMSPEQAMGEREITARSDVYALGAVLYELLTGDPPFTGSTAQAIVARVVTERPRSLTSQRHTIPPQVEDAVLTALEKLPADRFASAAEFAAALVNPAYASAATRALPSVAPRSRRARTLGALGWIAAAVAAGAALWSWRRPAPPVPVLRYVMLLPTEEQLVEARGNRIAISPDGSRLVYVGKGPEGAQLWLRPRNQLHATPIPGTDRATIPFFSPDGNRVGYVLDGNTMMKIVTLSGAPPITIADSGLGADGATWSGDGFVYYDGLTAGGTTGLMRVAATGGRREQVTTVDTAKGEVDHYWPVALPGGRGVLFTVQRRNSREASDVEVLDLKTLKHHSLIQALSARYAPGGHLVYVTSGGDLMAVRFDLERLAVASEPFALTSGVAGRGFGAVELALSETGTLVYQLGARQATPSEVMYVNRDGTASVVDSGLSGDFQTLALSPDGRRLAISKIDGSEQQVWVKQLPGGPLAKLTFEGNLSTRPSWTPDGQSIGFISNLAGRLQMYRRRVDGSGGAELVGSYPGRGVSEGSWSRDGRWLLFRTNPNDIFAQRLGADTGTVRLVAGAHAEVQPALSPDGKWLAYTSAESGRGEVFVRPFPDAQAAKWQVSTTGGSQPRWSHDGRELFYIAPDNTLVAVDVIPGPTFVAGRRRTLFAVTQFVGVTGSWDLTPDDKRFVMIRSGAGNSSTGELVVVENLLAELRIK